MVGRGCASQGMSPDTVGHVCISGALSVGVWVVYSFCGVM